MADWIDVRERLPEIDKIWGASEEVLVYAESGYWIGKLDAVVKKNARRTNERH